jgi:hypothetical protein
MNVILPRRVRTMGTMERIKTYRVGDYLIQDTGKVIVVTCTKTFVGLTFIKGLTTKLNMGRAMEGLNGLRVGEAEQIQQVLNRYF